MLISELIEKLHKMMEIHGDLPVVHNDDWAFFEITNVEKYDEEGAPPCIAVGGMPIDIHASSPRWNANEN